ncbi:unnamed protein product [Paramecium sonneborni]|uniref:Cytochrome b5 heme-binding domain-containing protein n=1 Tax=Paramecium sonneborni TaxID=65129 RepID=A0A8S1L235_9CILI|nr:unnamed protein product [Paramecium sonneborni]
MSRKFTWQEVGQNAKNGWIVIGDSVYGPQGFLDSHPGGPAVIRNKAGKDVTRFFNEMGHSDKAHDILKSLKIGEIDKNSKPDSWQVDKDQRLVAITSILLILAFAFVYFCVLKK